MKSELDAAENEYSVSQGLIEAALSGNESAVSEALCSKNVDVNYKGTLSLRFKRTNVIQHEDTPDEVKIEFEEFKTDVTPLFAAAHGGHINIAKKLLIAGADVNEKLFRGYATTAAAREGHHQIIDMMQRGGASQPALEDALLEACLCNQVKSVEVLISSEMMRPEVLAQAVVHASSRGYLDIVTTLIKSGVNANSWYRILLRSARPALHANVDCTPLVAAIVARHAPSVKYLLEVIANVSQPTSFS